MDDLSIMLNALIPKLPDICTGNNSNQNQDILSGSSGSTPQQSLPTVSEAEKVPPSSASQLRSEILDVYEPGLSSLPAASDYAAKLRATLLPASTVQTEVLPPEPASGNALPSAETDTAGAAPSRLQSPALPSAPSSPLPGVTARPADVPSPLASFPVTESDAQLTAPSAPAEPAVSEYPVPETQSNTPVIPQPNFPSDSAIPDMQPAPSFIHPLTNAPVAAAWSDSSPDKVAHTLQNLFRPLLNALNITLTVSFRNRQDSLQNIDILHTQQILTRLLITTSAFCDKRENIHFIIEHPSAAQDNDARVRFVIQATNSNLPQELIRFLAANAPLPEPPLASFALNLGLCKNLSLLMGGSLLLRQETDEGVLFLLDLPVHRNKDRNKNIKNKLPAIGRFTGRRILLHHASENDSDAICSLLTLREMQVDCARTEAGALHLFRHSRPAQYSAILTIAPCSLVPSIRRMRRPDAPYVPIIGILNSESQFSKALQCGADFCLLDSFQALHLFQVLDNLIP